MAVTDTTHYLYHLGQGDEVIYVGETNDVERRVAQHRVKSWGPEIEWTRCYKFPNERYAKLAELEDIKLYQPRYNLDGNTVRPERKNVAQAREYNGKPYRRSRDARMAKFLDILNIPHWYIEHHRDGMPTFGVFLTRLSAVADGNDSYEWVIADNSTFQNPLGINEKRLQELRAELLRIVKPIPEPLHPQRIAVFPSTHDVYRPMPWHVMKAPYGPSAEFAPFRFVRESPGEYSFEAHREGEETNQSLRNAYDECRKSMQPCAVPELRAEDNWARAIAMFVMRYGVMKDF